MDFILIDLHWFLTGLLLFLFFSFIKAHIYVKLQPGVMDKQIKANNPFGSYPKRLWRDTKAGGLFKATYLYLLRSKKTDWMSIKNEKIDAGIEVLNGFTNVLKPYLIVSLLFFLIKCVLAFSLHYEALTVGLGKVQQMLSFLNELPMVVLFYRYKTYIFLALGILVILVPWLYSRRKKTKILKKYATQILIYFSLLTSVSFFGVKIGTFTEKQTQELRDVEIKITTIHNQIFKTASKPEIEREITALVTLSKKQYDNFATVVKVREEQKASRLKDLVTRAALKVSYQNLLERIKAKEQLDSTSVMHHANHLNFGNHFSAGEFSNYLRLKAPKLDGTDQYLGNTEIWNIQEGQKRLNAVKSAYKSHTETTRKNRSKISPKTYTIIQKCADLILNKSINEIASLLPVTDNFIAKKIIKIVATKKWRQKIYKKGLAFLGIEVADSEPEVSMTDNLKTPPRENYLAELDQLDAKHKALNDERLRLVAEAQRNERLIKENKAFTKNIEGLIQKQVERAFTPTSGESLDKTSQKELDRYMKNINRELRKNELGDIGWDPAERNTALNRIKDELSFRPDNVWKEKISGAEMKINNALEQEINHIIRNNVEQVFTKESSHQSQGYIAKIVRDMQKNMLSRFSSNPFDLHTSLYDLKNSLKLRSYNVWHDEILSTAGTDCFCKIIGY